MKIDFVCKRYYTNKDLLEDRFGRLYHLPIQLQSLSAEVRVIAIDYRSRTPAGMNAEGVEFLTVPATPTQLPALVPHLAGLIRERRPDIVIASGDSHIGYLALRLARRVDARFVFDVYDDYRSFRGNRIPGMKWMFGRAAAGADSVLCASTSLVSALARINRHTLLIENGVDRSLFYPQDRDTARQALGLDTNSPVIGYFGSITPTRGPLLIEACRRLRSGIPDLRLLLAGKKLNIDFAEPWILYQGELPQERIPALIAACDVVAIPYAVDAFNAMTGACKIAEYLACARPVVATRISDHVQIFGDVPGSICEPDPDAMAAALRHQLHAREIAAFPEEMTWEAIGQMLYQKLVSLQRPPGFE